MKLNLSFLTATAFAASLALVAISAQAQTPVIQYDTWPADGLGNVTNTGTSGSPGTLIPGATYTYPTGPDDGALLPPNTAIHFDDGQGGGGSAASGINSGLTVGGVSGADQTFTMAAWLNLDDHNGDNMVFGSAGDQTNTFLHLGFRNGDAYFGVWGAGDSSVGNGAPAAGTWAQYTWTFTADPNHPGAFVQSIYENGALLGSADNRASLAEVGQTLLVGTTGGNGGDLHGSLDDVRVYNTGLDANGVAALFTDMSKPDLVPEPSTMILLGWGAIGLFVAARRRK